MSAIVFIPLTQGKVAVIDFEDFEKVRHYWAGQITVSGKRIFLGHFKDEEAAARAYDKKAREFFGEFASPNFPL